MEQWAAVVLAGGTAARLGGVDKGAVEVRGRSLLEHVLDALPEEAEVVVVGDAVPTSRPVTFTREEPRLGGPVAGLVAGVRALTAPPAAVVVLAVDMPMVGADTVGRLALAAAGHDGAFLHDGDGRRQLAGVLTRAGLAQLPTPADAHDRSVRSLLAGLDLAAVPALGDEATDVDTWSDLRELG